MVESCGVQRLSYVFNNNNNNFFLVDVSDHPVKEKTLNFSYLVFLSAQTKAIGRLFV